MSTSPATAEASLALRTMAVESQVLNNLANTFLGRFGPLKELFAKSFTFSGTAPTKASLQLTAEELKLCRRVEGANFVGLSKFPVHCAPGWNANLAEVRPIIFEMIADLKNFNRDILQPYCTALGIFISDKDAKIKGKDNSYVYKQLEQKRKADQKIRRPYFADPINQGTIALGKLIARASELDHAFDDMARARSEFSEVDFNEIKETLTRSVASIDEIMAQIENGTVNNMPSDTALTLATGALEIAEQAEFQSANAMAIMNYLGLGPNIVTALKDAEKQGLL